MIYTIWEKITPDCSECGWWWRGGAGSPAKPGSISRVVDIAQDSGVAKLEIEDI